MSVDLRFESHGISHEIIEEIFKVVSIVSCSGRAGYFWSDIAALKCEVSSLPFI